MSKISSATYSTVSAIQSKVQETIKGCTCLEEAAQQFTDVLYEEFEESIVLVRLFATVPFGKLPSANQAFVSRLAASARITPLIGDQTLVLSLLGTRGLKAAWNDRRRSRGHAGIPLASADFIEAVPMMSRLLKSLGVGLDWIDSRDTNIVTKTIGKMAGVFHVPDAKTAVDEKGRKIIVAQDFVATHNVKTVFGLGGGYIVGATSVVIIVFTRETLDESQARQFMSLVNVIKFATTDLVSQGRIFS